MRTARGFRSAGTGQRWRRRLIFALLPLTTLVWGAAPGGPAQAQRPSPDDVEAAYLYNFGKFVRWPESAVRGPLVICVAGQDSLGQTVKRLVAGEQINGRSLDVRILDRPEGLAGCSILYVGSGARARLESYLKAAAGNPVLTVGESPDFLDRGGILQFVEVGDHVRFAVNLDGAARHGLWLSSELLKVAVSVKGSQGSGGAR